MNTGSVLVTGANGFLGKAILSCLLKEGVTVCATDIGSICATAGITYKKADITRPEELVGAIQSADTLIHAAGLAHMFNPTVGSAEQLRRVNEIGTENVARASAHAGVRHFILISSVSVYGSYTNGIYNESTSCDPVGPYAHSKYYAEQRAIEIASESGMALTVLRLATLYGEGDPGNVGRLMRALDRGRFFWIGDGRNRKSLLHKEDAARACSAVAASLAVGVRVYNVSAPPCTMREIVDGLATALNKKVLPGRIPASIAKPAGQFLSCLPGKTASKLHATIHKWLAEDVYDTGRIESEHGFHAGIGLAEGLEREVRWYRQSQGTTS